MRSCVQNPLRHIQLQRSHGAFSPRELANQVHVDLGPGRERPQRSSLQCIADPLPNRAPYPVVIKASLPRYAVSLPSPTTGHVQRVRGEYKVETPDSRVQERSGAATRDSRLERRGGGAAKYWSLSSPHRQSYKKPYFQDYQSLFTICLLGRTELATIADACGPPCNLVDGVVVAVCKRCRESRFSRAAKIRLRDPKCAQHAPKLCPRANNSTHTP